MAKDSIVAPDFSAAARGAQTKTNFQPMQQGGATPTYIAPGASGGSATGRMAQTIAGLIPGAVSAYEGYQTGTVLKKAIQPDIDRLQNYLREDDRAVELGATVSLQEQNVLDGLANKPSNNVYTDQLMKTYEGQIKVLGDAQRQGKISPKEFSARYQATLREQVSRTPWLEQELYSKGRAHLQNLGISDEIAAYGASQAKASDAAAAKLKTMEAEAKEQRIKVEPGTTPTQLDALLQAERTKDTDYQNMQDNLAKGLILRDDQVIDAFTPGADGRSRGGDLMRTGYKTTVSVLSQIHLSGKDKVANNIAATQYVEEKIASLARGFGRGPEGLRMFGIEEKRLRGLLGMMNAAGDGSAAAKIAEDAWKTFVAVDNSQFNLGKSPAATEHTLKIINLMGPIAKDVLFKDPHLAKKMLLGLTDVTGDRPAERGSHAATELVSSGNALKIFQGLVEGTNLAESLEQRATTSQFYSNVTDTIYNGTLNDFQKQTAANDLLKQVATNPTFSSMAGDYQFALTTAKHVDYTMKATMRDMFEAVTTEGFKNPTLQISYDVLPNGVFKVVLNDTKMSGEFQEKFSNQINNALDAHAKSMGMTRTQAAPDFYKSYFQDLVGDDPDLKGMAGKPKAGAATAGTGAATAGTGAAPVAGATATDKGGLKWFEEGYTGEAATPAATTTTTAAQVAPIPEVRRLDRAIESYVPGETTTEAITPPPPKAQSTINAEKYQQERKATIDANTKVQVDLLKKMVAENPLKIPIALARLAANSLGMKLEEFKAAEADYRARVRGEKPR